MNNYNFELYNLFSMIPFIFLYMEMHYKFKWLPSRYFKREPEIISDVPIRIEPKEKLPILILIKDSDKYPILLSKIKIQIYKNSNLDDTIIKEYKLLINSHWWSEILLIDVNKYDGYIEIDINFYYSINGVKKNCKIHNYLRSTNSNHKTYISKYQLPRKHNVLYGDLHYHTNLTEDMVEFGAPIDKTLAIAQCMGIDFFCTTDHSYDLDDKYNSWTETDPELLKWNDSRNYIKKLNNNKNYSSFIIPAEELSMHNTKSQNIHALILNNDKFLPGAGDGAEEPFNFSADYNTFNLYDNLEDKSICIAAHPYTKVPFLQKIFFRRGSWHLDDIKPCKLAGLQILNGAIDNEFYDSLSSWIKLLLNGYKKFIYAGNDAHGNFNIFRQIQTPMLTIKEKKEQIFGHFKTAVLNVKNNKDINQLINQLRYGNCFITNGPYLNMTVEFSNNDYYMGSTIKSNNGILKCQILSTPEFGTIYKFVLIKGYIHKYEERLIEINKLNSYKHDFSYSININTNIYIRCEVKCLTSGGKESIAYSNPIWIEYN